MNTRIPLTLSPSTKRKPLFKRAASGGVQLNVPAYALEPGQVATFAGTGGAKLALGAAGGGDEFLQINPDGSASIKL